MKTLGVYAAIVVFTAFLPAKASIIGGSVTDGTAKAAGGTFVYLTAPLSNPFGAPDSVGNDNFQSPNLFAFNEEQNVLLGSPVTVDVGGPVAAGTLVSSYYIFFDPGPTQEVIGVVNFDSDVLAIITTTSDLAASDSLSNPGVNYLNPSARGLEAGDSVTISGPRQILFDTVASSPGDYVRVLTEASIATPEPGSGAFLLTGLGALAILLGRKRARAGTR